MLTLRKLDVLRRPLEPWCTTHFNLYLSGFWVEFFISSIFLFIHLFILIFNYRKRKPWMLLLTMKNLIVQHFSWLHDRVNHVALHVVETETLPNIYFNEKEVSKRSQSGSVCRSSIFFCSFRNKYYLFIFFLEGTVTNPAIWSVLYPVSNSYLCPRATVTLSWIAEYIPTFVVIFHKYTSFSGWAVFLSKHVGHYLKPINNLWILSFLSLKLLWLTEKYWFQNELV